MPQRYEVRHQGPAIVCGGAPCVFKDLESVIKIYPQAAILGVNNAAAMIPEVDHVWTQHNNYAREYKLKAGRPIKIHARAEIAGDEVDYWWNNMVAIKGSSGVVAAIWARAMGFDEVIMAGIPLSNTNTGYHSRYPDKKTDRVFATENSIIGWQQMVRFHKKQGRTQGIYSMSGYTRHVFGPPPGLEN